MKDLNIIKIKKAGELRNKLKENCLNIVIGGNEAINRAAVSNKKVDILLNSEKDSRKDFMKSRNSGLNQVLCKLAHKNKVAIGFDFQSVLNSDDLERADMLGRMILNVELCRKYKLETYIVNLVKDSYEIKNKKDLEAFASTLGIEPGKIKVLQK